MEARDYTRIFAAIGKDGKYFKSGTYTLRLGAVTILNGRPYTIQAHREITLGPQPATPKAGQKPVERRIQIIEIYQKPLPDEPWKRELYSKYRIVDTLPGKRDYTVIQWLKPVDKEVKWENIESTKKVSPNLNTERDITINIEKYPQGKYYYVVTADAEGVDRILSDVRAIEIKSQPAKKAEEFQVVLIGVNPDEAQYISQGVPVGTIVKYQLQIKGGEPEFKIKSHVVNPDGSIREPRTDPTISRDYKHLVKPLSKGATKVNIIVIDRTGRTARAQIVIYAK